jgi:hypothetical protein
MMQQFPQQGGMQPSLLGGMFPPQMQQGFMPQQMFQPPGQQ